MIRLLTTTNRGVYTNGRSITCTNGRGDIDTNNGRSITTALAHSDVIRSR